VALFSRKSRPARRKTNQDAWLAVDGSFATRKCKVLDLSDGGAKLKVEDSQFVRSHVRLKFTHTDHGRPCKVIWRKGSTIGVEFG
jgi:hypothetical protein